MVEGTLQLVADPLAAVAAASPACQQDTKAAADSIEDAEHGCWTKVYETRAGGYAGSSGISMQ